MIAPPNIADGTIISGRGPSSGKLAYTIKQRETKNNQKYFEYSERSIVAGMFTRKKSLAWEYIPNINELSKAIPRNEDVAPL